jgi:hypothetical protein
LFPSVSFTAKHLACPAFASACGSQGKRSAARKRAQSAFPGVSAALAAPNETLVGHVGVPPVRVWGRQLPLTKRCPTERCPSAGHVNVPARRVDRMIHTLRRRPETIAPIGCAYGELVAVPPGRTDPGRRASNQADTESHGVHTEFHRGKNMAPRANRWPFPAFPSTSWLLFGHSPRISFPCDSV